MISYWKEKNETNSSIITVTILRVVMIFFFLSSCYFIRVTLLTTVVKCSFKKNNCRARERVNEARRGRDERNAGEASVGLASACPSHLLDRGPSPIPRLTVTVSSTCEHVAF